MQEIWRSFRHGLRILFRKPVFALAVLLSLMLGIGVNTALFTLLDRLFLNPLAIEKPEEVISVFQTLRERGEFVGHRNLGFPNYLDYRDKNQALAGLAAFQWGLMNLTGVADSQRVLGMHASSNYFDLLGVQPAVGSLFTPGDDLEPEFMTVLSHSSWRRLFGGDPDVVGSKVTVNGHPFTVIGVAEEGFRGTLSSVSVDLWIPISTFPMTSSYGQYFEQRDAGLFQAFGRLKEGVTREQAEADLHRLAEGISEAFLKNDDRIGITTLPIEKNNFGPQARDDYVVYGQVLGGAVVIVLLLACLNVANLLLVRARERRRELATRMALGCTSGGLVRQLLVETFGIFFLGALLSLPVARWCLGLLWKFRPPQIRADALDLTLDARVLLFAFAVAGFAALLFGLLPALRASRPDLVASLKDGGEAFESRPRWRWARPQNLLVIAQVALALTALVSAGLFILSLRQVQQIDLGFDPEGLAVVTISPGDQGYDEPRSREIFRQALDRLGALPGVRQVTLSSNRLLRGSVSQRQVFFEGEDSAAHIGERSFHRISIVIPGYFAAVGIPLLDGEDFSPRLDAGAPPVAIINQTMARTGWPGESAIGKRFSFDYPDQDPIEVVGVVGDSVYREITEAPQFFIYLPFDQVYTTTGTLHLRTAGDPSEILPLVRRELRDIEPNLVQADLQPLSFFIDESLWLHRMAARLLSVFGGLALVLAIIGVFGVLSYSVAQRQREIATRMAVGAQRSDILGSVLREAMLLVLVGWGAGLMLSLAVVRPQVAVHLVDVDAADPKVYLVQSLILIGAALIGTLVPLRRAVNTDPMRLLRGE